MSLSRRQRRLLTRIDDSVCRSDSHLASMLDIFGQLTADEELPDGEQLPAPRVRATLPRAVTAIGMLIIRAGRRCDRGIRSAEAACVAACIAGGQWPAS